MDSNGSAGVYWFGIQFISFQFKMVSVYSEKAHNYALHPVSQKFPQFGLRNSSNVHLIDDGPLLSFQGRSSSASSFHAFHLQRSMV